MLALCKFCGVGPRLFDALFARFGSLKGILDANRSGLMMIEGMSSAEAGRISKAVSHLAEAESYELSLKDREIGICTRFDATYDPLLFELNDPPTLLYVRGRMPELNRKTVTLVGAEIATVEGLQLTSALAKAFANAHVQVISSLSLGADSAAHLACRTASGTSYAVLDHGFDLLDKSDGFRLALDVAQAGGVISEYSPELPVTPDSLQESNRLLAGLSQAVVVTQLFDDSKRALDLLDFCNMMGKLAFVVTDIAHGVESDVKAYQRALATGAIPLDGVGHVNDIVISLV
ncbi:MAG TPA: DNA-processing protein DprA [Candidatus Acidoferrum sp.]|nr:DNA-processing protein DprA [Candidatus Acidoferrum sp.]